jgi:hypothetical protein
MQRTKSGVREKHHGSSSESSSKTGRKPYRAPRLKSYGRLRDITAGASGGRADGTGSTKR